MSERIPVIEPTRTRNVQIGLCTSLVLSLLYLTVSPSEDGSVAAVFAFPTALFTVPHHLTIIVLAFRQRRRLYTPEEIPNIVPVTGRAAVVLSTWACCCFWLISAMFYLMSLGAKRHKTLCVLAAVEAGVLFGVSVMATRERLELLERRVVEPTSLVFLVNENGEPTAMEGP